jgi:LysM repeat protein
MPVDYDLQLQGIQQNSQYQDLLTQIAAQRNAAAQNRVVGLRDAQTGEVDQQRRDINNASYRGMARSSGYVTQIDKTQQYFNNLKTDIESRFMAALNNAQGQEIQGKSALDSTMEAIYREAARRLAEKIANDPNAGPIDKLPDTPTPPATGGTSGSGNIHTNPGPGGTTPTPRPAPRPTTPPKTTTTAPKTATPTKYTVKSGDSLAAIAKRYNISLAALKKANPNLASRDWRIYSGSKLVIPGK